MSRCMLRLRRWCASPASPGTLAIPMEPVTHLLTGACLGRAGFNRKTAYATLAMTLAAEVPDLDMLWGLRGPLLQFQHHRGFTHTLLGALVVALVVTLFCWGIHKLRRAKPQIKPQIRPRWIVLWLCALVAALSHILLDFTNSYGVRPFAPFDSRWYSGDVVFICKHHRLEDEDHVPGVQLRR